MIATKYQYDVVDGFWKRARDIHADLQRSVETNLNKWSAANEQCSGVAAIPSIVKYLDNAQQVCETIGESIELAIKLNEEYHEQMADVAADVNL